MAGLQRSAISFRRQGSSGLIWEDKLLSAALQDTDKEKEKPAESKDVNNKPSPIAVGSIERSRSNGGGVRAFRTGKVSPAIEPPSPKVSACGLCGGFGKKPAFSHKRRKSGKSRTN